MLFKSVSIMTMWDVPFVSFLQSTNSKTSITQRCLCPTHMGSRAFHIAVLLKGGWTRRQRRMRGKSRSVPAIWIPPSWAHSSENQVASGRRSIQCWPPLAAGEMVVAKGNQRAVGMQSQPSTIGCTCSSASPICSNGTHTSNQSTIGKEMRLLWLI